MTRAERSAAPPRLVVAGLAGDSGKSLVALGLAQAFAARGFRVAGYKKGPDFIDAAWLGAATDRPGRNLDTFLMSDATVIESFVHSGSAVDLAVVEGNRGLYDGFDAAGSHSTAALAKLLHGPVVLVVDTTKCTRTVAALVLGCRTLDPDVTIAGVVLNRVGTQRQERLIREALATDTDVPVVGAIPRLKAQHLPSRHLGLVTAMEHPTTRDTLAELGRVMERHVDVPRLLDVARAAGPLEASPPPTPAPPSKARVRVGVLRDRAFSFYYPENLEALEAAGAELVYLSPLGDTEVPEIDALYAGGGFPESHAPELAANTAFREALALRIRGQMPVWAECGGLSYLARTLVHEDKRYPMVGALPVEVEQTARPQGHGYVVARVAQDNPFFELGTVLRGHEFHYARVIDTGALPDTMLALERGVGVGSGRDGFRVDNVVATFTHLHALSTPGWAPALVGAAERARAAVGRAPDVGKTVETPSGAPRTSAQAARGRPDAEPARARAERYREERAEAVRQLGKKRDRAGRRGLRRRLRQLIESQATSEINELVAADAAAVRHLLSLSYQPDPELRRGAAQVLGVAGKYHPQAVQNVIRRLVWAMNDESGTNAATAPEVLSAIAEERPELLLPMVPDLIRLAADERLREGLTRALRTVAQRCPGHVAEGLTRLMMDPTATGGARGVQASR